MEKNRCSGCQKYKEISEFESFKTCKFCRDREKRYRTSEASKKNKHEYYERTKDRASEYGFGYRRSLIGRFKKLRAAAIKRNINFNLTFEQYSDEVLKLCYYCDGFFPQVAAGYGLDKINPNKGYTYGNVISCCLTCNRIKSDCFTKEEAKAAVCAILKIRKKKND
jgi:hypothetical protein